MNKRPRIALVVGAGSVKSAAALGLWKVLNRENLKIDMLIGSSGGSIYAACMALGFGFEQTLEYTKKLWTPKLLTRLNWRAIGSVVLPGIIPFNKKFSLISDKPLNDSLYSVFGDMTFAEASMPLYLAATDLHNGEQVMVHSGKITDGLRASISLPYVWPAWEVDGRLLIDGGPSNPMPVDVAIRENADLILAMGFQDQEPQPMNSMFSYSFQIAGMMVNNLYQANFSFHNAIHHAEIVPIFPEFDRPIGVFDTHEFPYIIEQGEKATEEQIPFIRELLKKIDSGAA
jgi:NTE family protein